MPVTYRRSFGALGTTEWSEVRDVRVAGDIQRYRQKSFKGIKEEAKELLGLLELETKREG